VEAQEGVETSKTACFFASKESKTTRGKEGYEGVLPREKKSLEKFPPRKSNFPPRKQAAQSRGWGCRPWGKNVPRGNRNKGGYKRTGHDRRGKKVGKAA